MKRVVERNIYYRCEICKQLYDDKGDAKACEQFGIEKRVFKRGDVVKIVVKLHRDDGSRYLKEPVFVEKAKLLSPLESSHIREAGKSTHVYEYEMSRLKSSGKAYAFSWEMILVRRPKRNKN